MIPYEDQFRVQFENVLANGYYILGREVELFEKGLAQYNSAPYCVGVSNGLDTIILGLKALNLSEGSEVVLPANTFIATILAVSPRKLEPTARQTHVSRHFAGAVQPDNRCLCHTGANVLTVINALNRFE